MMWRSISPALVLAAQNALAKKHSHGEQAVLELMIQCEQKVSVFVRDKMRSSRIAVGTRLHEDVTREVIFVLLKSALLAYRAENGASFDTYIFKIAERIFYQVIHRTDKISHMSADEAYADALRDCLNSSYAYEHERVTRVALAEALASLSEKERDAVLRHVFDVNTFEEIADQWEMPLSTTYRRIKSAIAKLRHQLTHTQM